MDAEGIVAEGGGGVVGGEAVVLSTGGVGCTES